MFLMPSTVALIEGTKNSPTCFLEEGYRTNTQHVRGHNSPWQAELPILYTTTFVIFPRRAEFHELGFSVVCESHLQSSIKALGEGREALFVIELGVLEFR